MSRTENQVMCITFPETQQPMSLGVALLILAGLVSPLLGDDEAIARVDAETLGMDSSRLARIDEIAHEGVEGGQMPGCVVLIGRAKGIAFCRAYGNRQVRPEVVPMTTDTVFDLASLTKPIATATSVMKLVEQGKLCLDDPVATHLREFAAGGKQSITIEQLLTHQGGLIPDNPLSDYENGPEQSLRRIYALKPHVAPGTRFVYTDVGFIVLAKVVERITGQDIHEYSHQTIFKPLGMRETMYLPNDELKQRAAPTEQRGGNWMRGEVHDPRAYRLGGVAGHAGLFSTGEDLARFARMMLGAGEVQILKSETIALMVADVRVSSGVRGIGWDKRSSYSSNRSDLFTERAFGHGGFTGTAIWIDPGLDLYVIFLSNRLHPDGKGSVNRLAARIGSIAAAAIRQ